MFVYVDKRFTVTYSGKCSKAARCEKCGTQFSYELERKATGEATAPYLLGQDDAKKRAAHSAHNKLEKVLAAAEDPVPCPQCQWINESAVRQYRKTHFREWTFLAGIVGAATVLVDLMLLGTGRNAFTNRPNANTLLVCMITAVSLVIITGILLLQHYLRMRFNPNRCCARGFPVISRPIP